MTVSTLKPIAARRETRYSEGGEHEPDYYHFLILLYIVIFLLSAATMICTAIQYTAIFLNFLFLFSGHEMQVKHTAESWYVTYLIYLNHVKHITLFAIVLSNDDSM